MNQPQLKKRNLSHYTDDNTIADSYHYNIKVKTNDDRVIYVTKYIFMNLDYFEKLFNSNMIESKTNEIIFSELNYENSKIYIELLNDNEFEFDVKTAILKSIKI